MWNQEEQNAFCLGDTSEHPIDKEPGIDRWGVTVVAGDGRSTGCEIRYG
jgi:hypothetical protein